MYTRPTLITPWESFAILHFVLGMLYVAYSLLYTKSPVRYVAVLGRAFQLIDFNSNHINAINRGQQANVLQTLELAILGMLVLQILVNAVNSGRISICAITDTRKMAGWIEKSYVTCKRFIRIKKPQPDVNVAWYTMHTPFMKWQNINFEEIFILLNMNSYQLLYCLLHYCDYSFCLFTPICCSHNNCCRCCYRRLC